MPLKKLYVVGRNNAGRPVLQHLLIDGTQTLTRCGRRLSRMTSRAYSPKPIPEILCMQKGCRS